MPKWAEFSDNQKDAIVERLLIAAEKKPGSFKENDDNHRAFLFGASVLNVSLGYVPGTIKRHKDFSTFIESRHVKFGRDAEVRIRTDIFWDARSSILPYREFSVLCAVYSAIGNNKGAVRIKNENEERRSTGWRY